MQLARKLKRRIDSRTTEELRGNYLMHKRAQSHITTDALGTINHTIQSEWRSELIEQ